MKNLSPSPRFGPGNLFVRFVKLVAAVATEEAVFTEKMITKFRVWIGRIICHFVGHKIKVHKIQRKDKIPFRLNAPNKKIVAWAIGMGKAYKGYKLFHCERCGYWKLDKDL